MKYLKKIRNYDLLKQGQQVYKKIPSLYKSTFWIVFIVLNIVYAYHTVNFFWGNHEWPLMRGIVPLNRFWYEGRFTETIPYLLVGSRFLPVLQNLFSFTGIGLSAILLAVYWGVPKQKFFFTGFCLIMALMPYNLLWFYHIAQACFFWGGGLIAGALLCYEKKWGTKFFPLWMIGVTGILFFVLGMNACFINTILIYVVGRHFLAVMTGEKVTLAVKKCIGIGCCVAGATALLKGGLLLASHYHILSDNFYNVQHISVQEIFPKMWAMLPSYFTQFTVTYPFVDARYLGIWGCLCGVSLCMTFWYSIRKKGIIQGAGIFLAMVIGLLFSSQLAVLVSKTDVSFWLRVTGYFGHYYIFALMLVFLCRFATGVWGRNFIVISFVILGIAGAYRDMYAMRVWKQGRDAEEKVMDRIMYRIEQTEGFSYDNKYGILMLGDPSFRKRYYDGAYESEDWSVLGWSYRSPWETRTYFNFYAPKDFINRNYRFYWNFDFVEELFSSVSSETLRFIRNNARVWPDKNSVLIKDGVIFIFWDQGELNELKDRISDYLRTRIW